MVAFVDVILPIPLENKFTYSITEAESKFILPGMRIAVSFGKSKIYTSIAFKVHQQAPLVYEAKPIEEILDNSPIITERQLSHWQWIAEYYMCSIGEVVRAALPSGFLLESETLIKLNTDEVDIEKNLDDQEFLIYEALQYQSSLMVGDVISILDRKKVMPVLYGLMNKKVITIEERLFETFKPKKQRVIRLSDRYKSESELNNLLEELSRAPKQRDVVMNLFMLEARQKSKVSAKDLMTASKASSSILKSLIDKGILEESFDVISRIEDVGNEGDRLKSLSVYQEDAYKKLQTGFEEQDVMLLHGVTSSGKTEIYVKFIHEHLKNGKSVLYLLPEIALTTQLVERLQGYFGNDVLVYHSRYNLMERMELWNSVLEANEAKVVIGARSSLFLPFHSLGLIIVDEEHETSFKQFDPAPRYHARDAAIVLGNLFQAKVLLGSATPSLESFYNIKQKKYGLVSLTKRFNDVLMPDIEMVDISEAYRKKRMKGHFSERLLEEIEKALEENKQIILFQNRRGYSPIVECLSCGHSPQCPNCDVTLTYHQYSDRLRCHYCGYNVPMHKTCEACGNANLNTKGFGTEQVEEEVNELFPKAKTARMDLDTTRGKYGHQRIISSFERHEVDILIGTQMVTKGLDFRNVMLVGIMNADTMLNFPDFRAHERSFQMLLQVSGRAGRTDDRGKVLIQSYNPYHQILQQVSNNDFKSMYLEQMDERHNYKYPPVVRLIKVTLRHKDLNKVNVSADWLAKSYRQLLPCEVLGPEFAPIARIRNQYHKNILVKIKFSNSLQKTKKAIIKINNSFQSIKDFRSVRVIFNVDPY
ncbi:replication restart helicase PriA [Aegicerativicinus sediminis]|uniref:replication restart helicase PriA n=1 Tax=Aegicerativicinus sediminis TaxID=2893202 RepID=UPI001E394B1A|nr:primosomal protein N' [Aegicerativicinus sediminis]